jgi:hypothetical protein
MHFDLQPPMLKVDAIRTEFLLHAGRRTVPERQPSLHAWQVSDVKRSFPSTTIRIPDECS